MEKRVVLVSAAVAVLGVAAAVLGFVAEGTKSKAFVSFDGQRCVYRRTPALVFGVVAALLALAALALATAASGCFGRRGAPATGRRSATAFRLSTVAWVLVAVAVVMFLYGAAMNRGGTRGLSTSRRGRYYRRTYYYGCAVLRNGIFSTASILSAAAAACAVTAYVYLQQMDAPAVPGQFAVPGVAMGQPQWAQPYPPPAYPPPMGYPAPPPYGGYGAKQPAGTA
ncbi:hypothetical protein PAHAL_1G299800 [Panicum hallii]|uniref:Uncharacterized protein n=1 Tax=Panicum hallii TaxID=206008 RepID=A0A2S3GQS6_9POAL|nr:uncharacterized protein LOC112893650 [Panicum hallii]PAN06941.1 hypothetical protein PAHAL_1G299800 [Panicum hallii]